MCPAHGNGETKMAPNLLKKNVIEIWGNTQHIIKIPGSSPGQHRNCSNHLFYYLYICVCVWNHVKTVKNKKDPWGVHYMHRNRFFKIPISRDGILVLWNFSIMPVKLCSNCTVIFTSTIKLYSVEKTFCEFFVLIEPKVEMFCSLKGRMPRDLTPKKASLLSRWLWMCNLTLFYVAPWVHIRYSIPE